VLGQFKSYAIHTTVMFYRNLYKALANDVPPEIRAKLKSGVKLSDAETKIVGDAKEVRRIARRTVTGILGMTALLAGTTGLPIYNTVKLAANAANSLFGNDEDGDFDFDTELRGWLADHLGKEAANMIITGPVSELTGANVASRTSMSNMWLQDADRNLEGADAFHELEDAIAGPMGGLIKNLYVGRQEIREGHLQRGIETMLPTAVKNTLKAIRFAQEGANTLRGDPILQDVSGPQAFVQALGFEPTALAHQWQQNTALKNVDQAVQNRRTTLMNAYAMAINAGDGDDRTRALNKIREYNTDHPEWPITIKTLRASLRQRARYSAQAVNGIGLNRHLRAYDMRQVGIDQRAAE
jgi:hypothetical protein